MNAVHPMEQLSLLWLGGADPHADPERERWGEFTQADLGIETLAEYISSDQRHAKLQIIF
jgi:hypothetical protein